MNKKKLSKKQIILIVACSVLAVILVALSALFIWAKDILGYINRTNENEQTLSPEALESILQETDPTDPSFTGPVYLPEEVTLPTEPAETVPVGDNIINVLLVGQDRREGQVRQRSDAMILCTVNKSEKTLTMTSFLRDVWVRIPGYYDERLNVPYAIGGFPLLNETLEYNFGVSADYNIEVDFSGFENAVNLVGGVDISLTSAEAALLNKNHTDWGLTSGMNHLTGKQALEYSRIRKLDNDFGRTNRQRTVLTALMSSVSSLGTSQLLDLAKGVLPMITTDMSDADILSLTMELAPLLPQLKIVSNRVPLEGAYQFASISGKSVIVISPENMEKTVASLKTLMDENS